MPVVPFVTWLEWYSERLHYPITNNVELGMQKFPRLGKHSPMQQEAMIGEYTPQKLRNSHCCVPFTATFSKRRKIGSLWSERCDAVQGSQVQVRQLKINKVVLLLFVVRVILGILFAHRNKLNAPSPPCLSFKTMKPMGSYSLVVLPSVQTRFAADSKYIERSFWIFLLQLLSHAGCFWIPFGDHPLKLERYRED